MARRRPLPEPDAADPLAIPVELQHCTVEDWAHPRTTVLAPHEVYEAHDLGFWSVYAWCRWRDARARWCEQEGIPHELQCEAVPTRAPRFRDLVAFTAAVNAYYRNGPATSFQERPPCL